MLRQWPARGIAAKVAAKAVHAGVRGMGMRTWLAGVLLAVAGGARAQEPPAAPAPKLVVYAGATLIDGTGGAVRRAVTVSVRGGRIARIAPEAPPASDVRRVDLGGRPTELAFAPDGKTLYVANYLADIAAASLIWPLGDRGLAKRLHRIRCPKLVLWGGQDELLPYGLGEAWGGATVIDGAGHLMEWDAPDAVAAALRSFLS